jgi:hypothetical protein
MSGRQSFEINIPYKIDSNEHSPIENKIESRSDKDPDWRFKKSPEGKRKNTASGLRSKKSSKDKQNRASGGRSTKVLYNASKIDVAFEFTSKDTIIPNLNRSIVRTKFWSGIKDKVSLRFPCKYGRECTHGLVCEYYHSSKELDYFNRALVEVIDDCYTRRIKELDIIDKDKRSIF